MTSLPSPGQIIELEPGLRRVLAPNPSPMTHWGTNTYLIGTGSLAIIDPGPDDPAHLAALKRAIGGAEVTHILITHAHRDHSTLAPALARETGAPILGFGPPEAGRSSVMQSLATAGLAGGGEGVDAAFAPDQTLADGDQIACAGAMINVLHTPGHFAGHLSFAVGDTVFTGDHIMGWASTLISPPDGDLTRFMASCERLLTRRDRVYYPGHGGPVTAPAARVAWMIEHRRGREAQILEALTAGPADAATLAATIYEETAPSLLPAATRNVLAHLIDLTARSAIRAAPHLSSDATFSRI